MFQSSNQGGAITCYHNSMEVLGMRINLPAAEADVVEAAFHYVLYSDVVSKPHKREMMARLASMQQMLACPPHVCGACPRKPTCETRILDIMASSA